MITWKFWKLRAIFVLMNMIEHLFKDNNFTHTGQLKQDRRSNKHLLDDFITINALYFFGMEISEEQKCTSFYYLVLLCDAFRFYNFIFFYVFIMFVLVLFCSLFLIFLHVLGEEDQKRI